MAKFYSVAERTWGCYLTEVKERCRGKDVLEYGCGRGGAAFAITSTCRNVVGIDISQVAIARARELAVQEKVSARATFQVMNAECLEFEDESFDLVCGTGILHHLDLPKAFSEIARVLGKRGTAIFIEPMGHNPAIRLFRRLTPRLRTPDEHPLLMDDLALEHRMG